MPHQYGNYVPIVTIYIFLKWYSHLNSLLQAAAIEPGQLGTVQAPPRLSQSQGVVNRFKRFAALIRIV